MADNNILTLTWQHHQDLGQTGSDRTNVNWTATPTNPTGLANSPARLMKVYLQVQTDGTGDIAIDFRAGATTDFANYGRRAAGLDAHGTGPGAGGTAPTATGIAGTNVLFATAMGTLAADTVTSIGIVNGILTLIANAGSATSGTTYYVEALLSVPSADR